MRFIFSGILILLLAGLGRAVDTTQPSDNAALQYWQALSLLPDVSESIDFAKLPGDGKAEQVVSKESMQFLHWGAMMPAADWGLHYDRGVALSPHMNQCRYLGNAGLLWARYLENTERFDESLQTTADVIALGRHTAANPIWIGLVTGYAIQTDAINQVAMQLPEMPKKSLANFSQRLKTLPPVPDLATALRQTAQMESQEILRLPQNEQEWILFHLDDATKRDMDAIKNDRQKLQAAADELHNFSDETIKMLALPPDQWDTAETAVSGKIQHARPIVQLLMIDPIHAKKVVAKADILFLLLHTTVAVEQNGPDAVKQFSDPIEGKPIYYRAAAGGFDLSSELTIDGKPVALHVGAAEKR